MPDILYTLINIQESVEEQERRNEVLQNQILELGNTVKLVGSRSYAEAITDSIPAPKEAEKIRVATGRTVTLCPKRTLLVTPKDEKLNCEETKKLLFDKLNPGELGVRPDRILKSVKSRIEIEFGQRDLTKNKAGSANRRRRKRNSRMAVYGLPASLTVKDLAKELQVYSEDKNSLIVKYKFGPKDKHYSHWVIETSPGIRTKPLEQDGIFVGWSSCVIKDHIRLIRCYSVGSEPRA